MRIIRGILTNATGYSFPVSITDTYYGIIHRGIPMGSLDLKSINMIKYPNAKVGAEYDITTIEGRQFTLKVNEITMDGGRRRTHRSKRRSARRNKSRN